MTRILVVDDELAMCELIQSRLTKRGFEIVTALDATAAREILERDDFDVVVTDLNMKGLTGLDLCQQVVSSHPDLPVILITAFGSLESAIGAIRAGAYDFITKPFRMEELRIAIDRAADTSRLRREVKRLRRVVDGTQGFDDLLGSSPAMRRTQELLERCAETDSTVLITGESGTGKELAARALHRRGRRASGPFVAVNCAAIPEGLLESQLFGYEQGAFTDARAPHLGIFVQANRGTLFLDEIGELPISLQVKLLRAFEERRVQPLGSTVDVPFDARIVAATNRDLETAVEEGRFREDLYFRINVLRVEMPALRERRADVLALAQHFLERFATEQRKSIVGISPAAAEKLLSHSWPGNVRELRNAIERAVALGRYAEITPDDLPEHFSLSPETPLVLAIDDPAEVIPLEQLEARYCQRVVQLVGGNRSVAARLLAIDRKTLQRRLGHRSDPGAG